MHFRHLMLFFYRKGKNVTQAPNKICAVYDEGAVAERTVQKWFAAGLKLVISILKIKNARAGSPPQMKIRLKHIENNSRYRTRKLTEILNISKSTIHEHFVKLGYINRFDVWVLHDLTEKNLMNRIFICDSLYKRKETIFEASNDGG